MIREFANIRKEDIAIVGGKGANLGEMVRGGLNVPGGFVVTSKAYRQFLKENHLDTFIEEKLKEAKEDEREVTLAAKEIKQRIEKGTLPIETQLLVRREYERLGRDVRVAIRSSATAEDLKEASFAGQQETYLNVQGVENVFEQIRNCYASLWGSRAAIYRHNHGIKQNDVAMAVVVQRMVESVVAGVLFTTNPVTGNTKEMQINASYGLGESVVSGRVNADAYICDRDGNLKSLQLGEKKIQVIYSTNGTEEIPVSEKLQGIRCLDDAQLIELCVAGMKVERFYKQPMDIEWGIAGKSVYIFQARPITTLENKDNTPATEDVEKQVQYCKCTPQMRDNMIFLLEKLPAPIYPLEDCMVRAINAQKEVILSEIGIKISVEPEVNDEGITLLPSGEKGYTKELYKIFGAYRDYKNYTLCQNKLDESMAIYKSALKEFAGKNYEKMSLKEAHETYMNLCHLVEKIAYARFKYAVFPSSILGKSVEKELKKIDEKYTVYNLYGNLDYRTAIASKKYQELAELIIQNPDAKADILSDMDYVQVCKKYPELAKAFDEFMKEYGYQSDYNCYCLSGQSYKEQPKRLLNVIKPLLSELPSEPQGEIQNYTHIIETLKQKNSAKKYEKLKKCIDVIRHFHVCREETQYYWEEAFFYARRAAERMSEILYETRDYKENIAYLFADELKAVAKASKANKDYQKKMDLRKGNRPLAIKVWDRCKMIVFGASEEVLSGVSGSLGEAVGRVCIIHGPEEFYKLQEGDILVCQYTDPEWTPLFKKAKAVVSDTGAALSHAAIVAREYGIPAVLGVGLATVQYKDGDVIRVDGDLGQVSKVNNTSHNQEISGM